MREIGYYWVRIRAGDKSIIAFWWQEGWLLPGVEEDYLDSDFEEIDERQILRE